MTLHPVVLEEVINTLEKEIARLGHIVEMKNFQGHQEVSERAAIKRDRLIIASNSLQVQLVKAGH